MKRMDLLACLLLSIGLRGASAATALAVVTKDLPRGAISLRWQKLQSDGTRGDIWGHLWCVPKGHSKEREQMLGEKKSGPVTREDINSGPSMQPSPFHFEIWNSPAHGEVPVRLNSVEFPEQKDVQEIHLRWLDANTHRKPVLLLHFGFTHWHEWQVLTFPNGWSSRAFVQEFLWGGEGGSNLSQRFDRSDARGQMIVIEAEWRSEEAGADAAIPKYRRSIFHWNGREWDDATLKYFVIGATENTRASTQKIRDKNGWGEVLHSDDFPRLRKGYWLWVTQRLRSLKEANASVVELKKRKIAAYARRAR